MKELEKNKFDFPYEPYDIQTKFMDEMYKTIESSKIGIFESPTGTVNNSKNILQKN